MLICTVVFAIPKDRAQRDVDDAQRRLNDADARLNDAVRISSDAQRADDDLRNRGRNLTRVIDDGQRRLEVIRRLVSEATNALPQLKTILTNSTKTAAEKKPLTQTALLSLNSAKTTTTQAKAKALGVFEASPDFLAKKQAVESAQAALDEASKACLAVLERTAEYKNGVAKVATNEELLRQARAAGKQEDVATASTTWIGSKNQVELQKDKALAADPDASSAKVQLTSAKKAQRDLREAFDAGLPKQPEVASALADQSSAQTAYDKNAGELHKAEATVVTSQKAVGEKQEIVDTGGTTIKQFENDIAARQRDLAAVNQDLATADRRLTDALNDTRNRQQDRNAAAARLRDTQIALAHATP